MAIRLSKTRQQEAIELVKKRYASALNFQRPLFVRFNEYYRMYRAIRDDTKHNYAGRAKLFIPYIFATIETIIPRLIGSKPTINAVPREPSDIENADINSSLFHYNWDIMNMKRKIKIWVKQALIYGTSIAKIYWQFEEDKYDQPNVDILDVFDFFVDPDATNMEDAQYVIQRAERNYDYLAKNDNYKLPKELAFKIQQDEYKVQRDAILGLSKPNDKDSKKVEILEYWGNFDINGDGINEECLLVIADKEYLIRAELNPYEHGKKPFIRLVDIEIPSSFWGIGEVEQLSSLQYELNDVRNQRMDNVTLILNRMWKVDKNADVDEQDLISQAGQIIHTGRMDGIEPLITPDVTTSAYNEETLIKADIQLVSGVTDYTQGQGNKSMAGGGGLANNTATGIMLLQEAGNQRFKYKLDNIEDALIDLGEQLLALNQQFLDKEMKLRIVGEGRTRWIEMNPDNLKGNFDIAVEAGSTQPMNKSVRRAEARELLQAVIPFAQLGIDIKYFIKYLLKTYELTDIDQAFPQEIAQQGGVMGGQAAGLPAGVPPANNIANPGAAAIAGLAGSQGVNQQANIVANARTG